VRSAKKAETASKTTCYASEASGQQVGTACCPSPSGPELHVKLNEVGQLRVPSAKAIRKTASQKTCCNESKRPYGSLLRRLLLNTNTGDPRKLCMRGERQENHCTSSTRSGPKDHAYEESAAAVDENTCYTRACRLTHRCPSLHWGMATAACLCKRGLCPLADLE
jgi:hypothetical protein